MAAIVAAPGVRATAARLAPRPRDRHARTSRGAARSSPGRSPYASPKRSITTRPPLVRLGHAPSCASLAAVELGEDAAAEDLDATRRPTAARSRVRVNPESVERLCVHRLEVGRSSPRRRRSMSNPKKPPRASCSKRQIPSPQVGRPEPVAEAAPGRATPATSGSGSAGPSPSPTSTSQRLRPASVTVSPRWFPVGADRLRSERRFCTPATCRVDVDAEPGEERRERAVQVVAVATPAADDPPRGVDRVDAGRPTEDDVERLVDRRARACARWSRPSASRSTLPEATSTSSSVEVCVREVVRKGRTVDHVRQRTVSAAPRCGTPGG